MARTVVCDGPVLTHSLTPHKPLSKLHGEVKYLMFLPLMRLRGATLSSSFQLLGGPCVYVHMCQ